MMIIKAMEDIRGLVLDEQAMVYGLNYPQIKLLMIHNTMITTLVACECVCVCVLSESVCKCECVRSVYLCVHV